MKRLCFLLALCLLTGVFGACASNGGNGDTTTESVTDPVTDAVTDPVTDSVTEPVTEAPKVDGSVLSVTSKYYELDNAMMAFLFYDFINQNYYYLVYYYGLDPETDLKEQEQSEGVTWFDFILDFTKDQVNELVALASEAKEKGFALTEADEALIDESLESLRDDAEEAGFNTVEEYIADAYVGGIGQDDIVACWELQLLASRYYEHLLASYEYTEEELQEYAKENRGDFYMVDYLYYIFEPDELDEDATDADKQAALSVAKQEAEDCLARITDEESFKALIVEMEKAVADAETVETEEAAEAEEEISDEEYLSNYTVEGEFYYEGTFGDWAFADERQAGDKNIIEITDGSEEETVLAYAVCYLTKTAYLEDYRTKNVRHILFTSDVYGTDEAAKAKAEEILALYLDGEKTAEAFGALAKEYTEDGNGDVGGLYENVPQGYMVETFNDWMYDEARQVGDTGIVETDFGYHIMYHAGDGMIAWQITARDALASEDYEAHVEELLTTYPVTYDDEKLALIP